MISPSKVEPKRLFFCNDETNSEQSEDLLSVSILVSLCLRKAQLRGFRLSLHSINISNLQKQQPREPEINLLSKVSMHIFDWRFQMRTMPSAESDTMHWESGITVTEHIVLE